jgi:hypothetical protein
VKQDKQILKETEVKETKAQDAWGFYKGPKDETKPKKFSATAGHTLPIFYKGSIIKIVESEAVEIEIKLLGYESKAQFLKALDDKQIYEVGEI